MTFDRLEVLQELFGLKCKIDKTNFAQGLKMFTQMKDDLREQAEEEPSEEEVSDEEEEKTQVVYNKCNVVKYEC